MWWLQKTSACWKVRVRVRIRARARVRVRVRAKVRVRVREDERLVEGEAVEDADRLRRPRLVAAHAAHHAVVLLHSE